MLKWKQTCDGALWNSSCQLQVSNLSCRFPKEAERRRSWLAFAQRDEGSLRTNSCLCSRHFEESCFTLSEEGQLTLSADAVPTVIPVRVQEDEVTPCDHTARRSDPPADLYTVWTWFMCCDLIS